MYLRKYVRPRWDKCVATKIKHHQIQKWFEILKAQHGLSNKTLIHLKQIMGQVFKYGRWSEMIKPDSPDPLKLVECSSFSDYKPVIVKPKQAGLIFSQLQQPDSTLVLLLAATGLRMSEALGLMWSDIDSDEGVIQVQRSWTGAHLGRPKSKSSKAAVPCTPTLAAYLSDWREKSGYNGDEDWIFPSLRNKGKTPMSGGIWVTNHLRHAAIEAGVLKNGDKRQFGAHNFRHSLATHLVATGIDIKTVQGLLRHANPLTTLALYAHGRSQDRSDAQGGYMAEVLPPEDGLVQ